MNFENSTIVKNILPTQKQCYQLLLLPPFMSANLEQFFCENVTMITGFCPIYVFFAINRNIIASMHSEFSSSSSYLDKYVPRSETKRPLSTYYDSYAHNQKPIPGKSLRWNIEESKENLKDDHRINFTNSLSALQPTTPNSYFSRSTTSKRPYETTLPQSKKTLTSKSYKTITFSNDLQKQYEKEKVSNQRGDEYSKKRENSKWLTMSMGYKTTINDLLPSFSKEDSKVERSNWREEPEMKRMKSSKSEKKIHYQIEEPASPPLRHQFSKNNYVLQYGEKSSKKILDKEEKATPYANKSCKLIKDDFVRPKMDKTASYNQHHDLEPIQKLYSKKHLTVESSRSYHHIDIHTPTSPKSPFTHLKHKISINDFEVGKCKGEGAFGQVFPAIHKASRMLVALKKVPKEKVKYMLQQFINEIKIQMFLDHPNIVKLYGFFDDSTHFYIIMEYMDGGNLFGLIKKKKKLTQAQTVQKLKQICLGLKEMHDNSILHRDIKPENIVMTNDVSKLCDFGWAAICKNRRTTYCGTLDYVSPQIIEGEGYDDSVDIWCIGVLAYELICGKTPFYNISRKQTMKRIRDVHYDYPAEISSQAKAFIDRILKKDPDQRIGIDQVLKDKFLNP